MVRKVIPLIIALAVLLAVPISASAEVFDVDEGNISTQILTYFEDIINKEVGLDENYVLFRSAQYEYILLIDKDLELSGSEFLTTADVKLYRITTSGNSYTMYYELIGEECIVNNSSQKILYSNLGHYPDLIERSNYYEIATLILLLSAFCIYLFRSIFGFCLRSKFH